ncbi:MAG: hypothetical protein M3464_13230 [Chloroflexota bacterium]|nr:hypothetical protein [Chloroflexota bacterium]
MIRRVLATLTRRGGAADPGPVRPNQLRREDVTAERRRREARRVQPTVMTAPPARAPHPAVSGPPRSAEPTMLGMMLSSRSGLRQLLLAREVLGPPLALSDRDSWQHRW